MKSRLSRRNMIKGSVALAATALARYPLSSFGFPEPEAGATLIPFLDQQPVSKDPMLRWEQLKSWITPSDQFFHVQHYGVPDFDVDQWRLEISGLVRSPKTSPSPSSNRAGAKASSPHWNVPATAPAR